MMSSAATGFALGLSLIVAIGAQNAFILRQGLLRRHVFVLCLICGGSDALLIAAGVGGVGTFVGESPEFVRAISIGGAAFLFAYAVFALKRALSPSALSAAESGKDGLAQAVGACLAFTFLNPHVYLDTVLLLGGLSTRHEGVNKVAFAIGAATASFVWFFALGYGARILEPVFARPRAWQFLDLAIAVIMAVLGVGLLRTL